MNHEESLSTLTQKPSKNVKKKIIQILATDFPLSTKQLHNQLQREHGITVTYQAVHKVMKELDIEGIANKVADGWQLNNEWLQNQEKFIQGTRQKYGGNKNKYHIDLKSDKPQVFHFDNFTDFSVETASLAANHILCQNEEPAYFLLEYGWWTLKFKFDHLLLLYQLVKNAPKSIHIIQKVTPFGKWVQKQYERAGGTGAIGIDLNLHDDFYIQGDWVIQVHFTEQDKKTIEKYWNKWKNLEDSFKEFGLKEEPKMSITTTITRNPTIAKFMKVKIKEQI